MSTDNVTVAVNVIQAVTSNAINIVSYKETIREPIISGAQGPQGVAGPAGATTVAALSDVDATGLTNGALLIYNNQLGLWKASKSLTEQTLECGQY